MAETRLVDWSSLWRKEDWLAVWLGFAILLSVAGGVVSWLPKIAKWSDIGSAIKIVDLPYFLLLGFGLFAVTAVLERRANLKAYAMGFPVVFLFALLSFVLANQVNVSSWGLEFAIWALIFGLLISNTVGTPKWLRQAVKTELFIKVGLVLLGAEILFQVILSAGVLGMVQAVVSVFLVWYFCYFLALRAGLGKEFGSILASGVSICGVSAAIATGGAIKGDPKKVSHAISLILLVAMPMLVGLPLLARSMEIPETVAGAWIGGTIDTTPAVVAAGALYSRRAMEVASIIKMSQNVLIGVVAFILALYWSVRVERGLQKEKPSPVEIWYRFPKFVVGFIVASALFSLLMVPLVGETAVKSMQGITGGIRGWFFAMAFVCVGLDTRFAELVKMGRGKPAAVFIAAQIFNILLTLGLAYLLFGGSIVPV
jgi:uncharacterized integral membrane protein (TIGR00698 family)